MQWSFGGWLEYEHVKKLEASRYLFWEFGKALSIIQLKWQWMFREVNQLEKHFGGTIHEIR